ncbi:ArnT family glycosyltransferase [Hymenobacter lapidiphilus]|uniref:Glycosyltransferase family 39 protein n=1 Tax=Hymenobacter lapidiphilus TaxID=2608003 RepID=A0A7Y7U5S2_9BACT|nr:glycosyltransferase family 39 protein [Hymenobacter lapidiphilus]NVO31602.1 glycosyltransferase family 39 protein [Hymenobacter lapidiphilus]
MKSTLSTSPTGVSPQAQGTGHLLAGVRRTVWAWVRQPENALFLLAMGLAGLLLLFELGRNPIQLWDESRVAVNSAEMDQSGNWLVTRFEGKPDSWNTKPPLLIWLQVLSLRLLGYSEWAIRLPTALATLGTVALVYWFAARTLRQPLAGLVAALVLATSAGYLRLHVARTGDYDALLVFWQVLLLTSFYRCLERRQVRQLYWVALAITAGVFTKSVAGLLGLPSLLLYALLRGRLGWLLRQPLLYGLALLAVASIAGFVLLREQAAPGYWQAVLFNDLAGRFLGAAPADPATYNDFINLQAPWDAYLTSMWKANFQPWIYLLPPALLLIGLSRQAALRWVGLLLTLFAIIWLTIISFSTAKLEWYDAPIYPALALLVGLGLVLGLRMAIRYLPLGSGPAGLLATGAVLLLGALPYKATLEGLIAERHNAARLTPDARLGAYLHELYRDQPQYQQLMLLYEGGYNASLNWYRYAYGQRNVRLESRPIAAVRSLVPETVVVFSDPLYRARLDSAFQTTLLHEGEYGQTVLLLPSRP